jgi:hypothetical protein
MTRIARYTPAGEVLHVISRFVDEQWFMRSDDDRSYYLRLLGLALPKTDWRCLGYALMSSHIHLEMVAGNRPASSWSRRVNSPYAKRYNELHERIGPVFAGRADMWIESTAKVGHLLAYIHNNPVRAHVVRRAADSHWTSHRAYLGHAECPPWLDVERGLALSGLARNELDTWVHEQRGLRREDLSLEAIDREAKRLGRIVLGTPTVEPVGAPLLVRPHAHVRPSVGRIVQLVVEVLGLEDGQLFERGGGTVGLEARTIVIQASCTFGLSKSAAGDAIGLSPTSACRLSERSLSASGRAALTTVCDRLAREIESVLKNGKTSSAKYAEGAAADG